MTISLDEKFSTSTFSLSTDEHNHQEKVYVIYNDPGEKWSNQLYELLSIKSMDVFVLPRSSSPNILPEKPDDPPYALPLIGGAYKKTPE